LNSPPFDCFDQVRIINLVDRPDRRREMAAQLGRMGALAPNVEFYDARRPRDAGGFPSLGARGCFESHLAALRSARDAKVQSLLVLEDDLDFTRDGRERLGNVISQLSAHSWDFFYGAHLLGSDGRSGLVEIPADEPIITASCVGFSGEVISPLVEFLEGILGRPPGSPDYGPMHVDGAYTVFRMLNPQRITFAAFPSLGRQRSSPSDITPGSMFLDRWAPTRPVAALLRRGYNILRRS
jgi:glycosyl transferase, family 25